MRYSPPDEPDLLFEAFFYMGPRGESANGFDSYADLQRENVQNQMLRIQDGKFIIFYMLLRRDS